LKRYFEGWYFKAQNKNQIVAVIPAIHIERDGKKSASIQLVTDQGAWNVVFPYEQFSAKGRMPHITIGDNIFTRQQLHLHIQNTAVTAWGDLKFGALSPLSYDIMGPFHFLPLMECRHSVYSMGHHVSGELTINGEKYRFYRDVGYMEGDRGRSFPIHYAWTQCNFGDAGGGEANRDEYLSNSLMLSVAEIPWGPFHFTGIIGVIHYRNKEYRIATYLRAKVDVLSQGKIVVSQGALHFTAELRGEKKIPLYAPVNGSMVRFVNESLVCTTAYTLEEYGETIFSFETDRASFEYEYPR
jgi:hypothetical protein